MKLKETLNLGKTAFPMRAGLPNKEPIWQKEWDQAKLYQRRQELNEGKPHFILHDGPPYANGNIHVGHAMNKISKDIIVRSKSMAGYYAPYIPGWDTHGQSSRYWLSKALSVKNWTWLSTSTCVGTMRLAKSKSKKRTSSVWVFLVTGIILM